MKNKSTVTNPKTYSLYVGFTHLRTHLTSRTNQSMKRSLTFRVRECIGGPRRAEGCEGLVVVGLRELALWLQMWQKGTWLVLDRSKNSVLKTFTHLHNCFNWSFFGYKKKKEKRKKKAHRGLLVQEADLVLNPFIGCHVSTHSRVRLHRGGHF